MTSRILGLVRDQVLASMFGAGNAMDAFNVAFRIPNLVRDLVARHNAALDRIPELEADELRLAAELEAADAALARA